MKKYSWQAIYLSFFSADLYRDVAKNWKGVGYLYLLLLNVGLAAIFAVAIQLLATQAITKSVDPIVAQLPKMTLDKGEMTIDKPSPYVIEVSPDTIIDFDMNKDAKFPDGKQGFFVTNSSMRTYSANTSMQAKDQSFDFSSLQSQTTPFIIDKQFVEMIIGVARSSVGIIVFFVRFVQLIIMCIVQSLVYSLVGLVVANVMKIDLSYGTLVRMTSVALSPGLIIDTINSAVSPANPPIPLWGFISMFVAIGYLIFAVAANRSIDDAITPAT